MSRLTNPLPAVRNPEALRGLSTLERIVDRVLARVRSAKSSPRAVRRAPVRKTA